MDTSDPRQKTELFEPTQGQEEYILRSRDQVISVLKELSKRPDIVTAYFGGGKHHMLTAVLAVLPERDLAVLDIGPEETLNRRAQAAERLVCVTKHDGVAVRFSLSGLSRAKFQGREVFAAPLPESVLRLQRREFFRVHVPLMNPVTCRIPCPDGGTLTLNVSDISVGGIGLIDPTFRIEPIPTTVLEQCYLTIPDFDSFNVDLEIRSAHRLRQRDGNEVNRIGCRYAHLAPDKLVIIQRYINKLQIEQRASQPD